MKRSLRIVIGIGLFFLILAFAGLWVGFIARSESQRFPEWVGNALAAITGGFLGMMSNLATVWFRQFAQRRQNEHQAVYARRLDEKERFFEFLYQMQSLLLRIKTYRSVKHKDFPSESLIPRVDEINQLMKHFPKFPSWLAEDEATTRGLAHLIRAGFELLLEDPDIVKIEGIEEWEEKCYFLMGKIHKLATHL